MPTKKKLIDKKIIDVLGDKYKILFDLAPIPMFLVNKKGVLVDANNQTCNWLGYCPTDLVGKKFSSFGLLSSVPAKTKSKKINFSKTRLKSFNISVINSEGKELQAVVKIERILGKGKKTVGFILIIHDVTEIYQKRLKINQQKSEFISVASHQLRTPLTSVNWFLEFLLDQESGPLNETQQEAIEQMLQIITHMTSLINDLLNISRIDAGRLKIKPKSVDLNKLIDRIIVEMRPLFMRRQQKFVYKYDENLPKVKLDEKMMWHILQNLLSNASKFTKDGGRVELIVKKKKNEVVFHVKDNGCGIPETEQQKVYQKFFRSANIVPKDVKGGGIGLYIIKKIIDASGGKTWFKSKENKGTSFYVSYPLSGMKSHDGEAGLI